MLVLLRVMPNSRLPPDTTRQCCPCRVRRCELSRPEKFVLCSAVALRSPTHSDAERTCRAVGPTQFPPPHQTRKTVLSVSCLTCRCEFGDWSERVQTADFQFSVGDSLELSGIQFKRTRHRQDSFVMSGWSGGVN